MITLVAEHWIKSEFMDQTMEVFERNTESLKARGDLVSRLVLRSVDDPTKITTVTTWKTEEGYRKFMDDLQTSRAQRDPGSPSRMFGEKLEGYEVTLSV